MLFILCFLIVFIFFLLIREIINPMPDAFSQYYPPPDAENGGKILKLLLVLLFLTLLTPLVSWGQGQPPTTLLANGDAGPVTLTWQDNASDELGFRIERKDGDAAWREIATVGKDVVTFTDKVFDQNTFCYRVYAFNSVLSDFSNESCITKPPTTTVPSAPGNVKLSNTLVLTWDPSPGANWYHVFCGIKPETAQFVMSVPSPLVMYPLGKYPTPNVSPYCYVKASNHLGTSGFSAIANKQ